MGGERNKTNGHQITLLPTGTQIFVSKSIFSAFLWLTGDEVESRGEHLYEVPLHGVVNIGDKSVH